MLPRIVSRHCFRCVCGRPIIGEDILRGGGHFLRENKPFQEGIFHASKHLLEIGHVVRRGGAEDSCFSA